MELDFVVVGMPRSGTSSFYSWLNSHPEIKGSSPKETFYFMDLEHPLTRKDANFNLHGIDKYKNFFDDEKCRKLHFEATTHYYYQDTALKFFSEMKPVPLIVFLLRKPSDRILSSFLYTRENLANINKQITFEEYVNSLFENKMENLRPHFYSEGSYYVLKNQLKLNKYINWLNKWENEISINNVHIIIFEKLIKSPREHIINFSEKICIDSSFYESFTFDAKNKTKNIKYQSIHKVMCKFNKIAPKTYFIEKLKKLYFSLQNTERLKNKKKDKSIEDSKAKLDNYFYNWNKKLGDKYNLDLDIWLKQ